jgi:2'-5' RNA ligase
VAEYEEIWESFVSGRCLEFGGHLDPGWQNGHTLSASLMIEVDTERFRERLDPLRDALRMQPFVSLHPDRFMHITLLLLGFLVPEPEEEGEISPERLTEIEGETRRALENFPPFDVELANLNAFPGAAFVEAHAGGRLEKLQRTLQTRCGIRKPPGPPHLTLAYFQAPDGTRTPDDLISAIERFRDWPVGRFHVSHVQMSLLDLGKKDYPAPEILAEIPLAG